MPATTQRRLARFCLLLTALLEAFDKDASLYNEPVEFSQRSQFASLFDAVFDAVTQGDTLISRPTLYRYLSDLEVEFRRGAESWGRFLASLNMPAGDGQRLTRFLLLRYPTLQLRADDNAPHFADASSQTVDSSSAVGSLARTREAACEAMADISDTPDSRLGAPMRPVGRSSRADSEQASARSNSSPIGSNIGISSSQSNDDDSEGEELSSDTSLLASIRSVCGSLRATISGHLLPRGSDSFPRGSIVRSSSSSSCDDSDDMEAGSAATTRDAMELSPALSMISTEASNDSSPAVSGNRRRFLEPSARSPRLPAADGAARNAAIEFASRLGPRPPSPAALSPNVGLIVSPNSNAFSPPSYSNLRPVLIPLQRIEIPARFGLLQGSRFRQQVASPIRNLMHLSPFAERAARENRSPEALSSTRLDLSAERLPGAMLVDSDSDVSEAEDFCSKAKSGAAASPNSSICEFNSSALAVASSTAATTTSSPVRTSEVSVACGPEDSVNTQLRGETSSGDSTAPSVGRATPLRLQLAEGVQEGIELARAFLEPCSSRSAAGRPPPSTCSASLTKSASDSNDDEQLSAAIALSLTCEPSEPSDCAGTASNGHSTADDASAACSGARSAVVVSSTGPPPPPGPRSTSIAPLPSDQRFRTAAEVARMPLDDLWRILESHGVAYRRDSSGQDAVALYRTIKREADRRGGFSPAEVEWVTAFMRLGQSNEAHWAMVTAADTIDPFDELPALYATAGVQRWNLRRSDSPLLPRRPQTRSQTLSASASVNGTSTSVQRPILRESSAQAASSIAARGADVAGSTVSSADERFGARTVPHTLRPATPGPLDDWIAHIDKMRALGRPVYYIPLSEFSDDESDSDDEWTTVPDANFEASGVAASSGFVRPSTLVPSATSSLATQSDSRAEAARPTTSTASTAPTSTSRGAELPLVAAMRARLQTASDDDLWAILDGYGNLFYTRAKRRDEHVMVALRDMKRAAERQGYSRSDIELVLAFLELVRRSDIRENDYDFSSHLPPMELDKNRDPKSKWSLMQFKHRTS